MKACKIIITVMLVMLLLGCKVTLGPQEEAVPPLSDSQAAMVGSTLSSFMQVLHVIEHSQEKMTSQAESLAALPLPDSRDGSLSPEGKRMQRELLNSSCQFFVNQPRGSLWDLDENGDFHVKANGSFCPIQLHSHHRVRVNLARRIPDGYVKFRFAYQVNQSQFLGLNDVREIRYEGEVDITEKRGLVAEYITRIEGQYHSQRHGKVQFAVFEQLQLAQDEKVGETTYQVRFPLFQAEGRVIYERSSSSNPIKHYINGEQVAKEDFSEVFPLEIL